MNHCEGGTRQRDDVEIRKYVDGCRCRDFEKLSGQVGLCFVGVHGWCCVSCRHDAVYDVVHCIDVGGRYKQ